MDLPASFPNPKRNRQAIDALLDRVRTLDQAAKARLATMLDEEMDLPYLDTMEREYAKTFREIAPNHAIMLRGRFVTALNQQREYLIGLVRNVLHEGVDTELQTMPQNATRTART